MMNKVNQISMILPEFCSPFLLETGTEMALSTRLAYARELQSFFEFMIGNNPIFCELELQDIQLSHVEQITSQDISRYLTIYKDKGHKDRTVARKKAALSRFFSYLVDNRMIKYNPVAAAVRVKIHKSDEVVHIGFDEQNKLLDAVDSGGALDPNKQKYHDRYRSRDLALITLLLDTGIRVSELQGINISDIDFNQCGVMVLRKGGDKQTVYFSDEVKVLIMDYIEERKAKGTLLSDSEPLFTTSKGRRLSVRAIEVLVKKYTTAALPGKGSALSPDRKSVV